MPRRTKRTQSRKRLARLAGAAPAWASTTWLTGRHMFIWRLTPVITAELGVARLIEKAVAAHLSSVWIKMAVGATAYHQNLGPQFAEVLTGLAEQGIGVWGWHEPRCKTPAAAAAEAQVVADLAAALEVKGVLMDAESPQGGLYFQGGAAEATAYASALRSRLDAAGLGLAVCSHDIPQNFPNFPFDEFAGHAHVNAPQVYYGGSPSVSNRLERAIKSNMAVQLPFVPVGAGWVGDAGGCASASACAERAATFIGLAKEKGFSGYSFWHWAGAPLDLWEVLVKTPA